MLHRYSCPILALAIGLLVWIRPSAAENPPIVPPKEKENAKPLEVEIPKHETVKVEKGPLTAAVILKGTLQSARSKELSVRLKTWTGQLIARKAVEHGATVKAGDILVEFEADKLDRDIRDARQERELAEVAIRQAELELPILERQTPQDIAIAEREFKQATEDMKRFLETDRKMAVQNAEFSLKSASFYCEYARDELKQLQKMYRDKDLTEETEQMILKRYKHSVESAELMLIFTKLETDNTLKVELPRRELNVKAAVEKAELALARARDVQPLVLQQKRLALAHLRYEDVKAKEHLAELEQDRAALTVKAPVDGVAYHGRFVGGQWLVPAGTQGPALLGVGQITPGDVFLTLVTPDQLTVRADAEEKELAGLKPGLKGRLTPTAFPEKKLPCEVEFVSAAPHEGKFAVRIKLDGKNTGLVPGMTCSTRFVTSQKKTALTVPASAVFEDAAEDIHYVYLVKMPGKHEKKTVMIGTTSGDRIEILDGLAEGDEILTSKP